MPFATHGTKVRAVSSAKERKAASRGGANIEEAGAVTEFNRQEARTFIDAMRVTLAGKTGFRWFVERLSGLIDYVDSLAEENEQIREFLGQRGELEEFAAFRESTSGKVEHT